MQSTSKSSGGRAVLAPATKSITGEDIENAEKRILKQDAFLAYWKVTNPKSGTLRLSKAITYVTGTTPKGHSGVTYHNAQGTDRLVYWVDYRVAGRISDIERIFREAGMVQVRTGALRNLVGTGNPSSTSASPLSTAVIVENSLDPLKADHAAFITSITQRYKPTKLEKKPCKYQLTDYIDLANALPRITSGTSGTVGTTKKNAKNAMKSIEHSLDARVEDWKTYFQGHGDIKKMIDATRYNPATHTGANKYSGLDEKSNMIILTSADNRRIPITAQNTPEGVAALRAYIQTVGLAAGATEWIQPLLAQVDQQVTKQSGTVSVMSQSTTQAPYTTWATSPQVPVGSLSPSTQFTAMAPQFAAAPGSLLSTLSTTTRLGM